jgi:hypothetical protein
MDNAQNCDSFIHIPSSQPIDSIYSNVIKHISQLHI